MVERRGSLPQKGSSRRRSLLFRLGSQFGKGHKENKHHQQQQQQSTKDVNVKQDEASTVATSSSNSSIDRRSRSRIITARSQQRRTPVVVDDQQKNTSFEAWMHTVLERDPSSSSSSPSPSSLVPQVESIVPKSSEPDESLMDEPWLTGFLSLGYEGHQPAKRPTGNDEFIQPEDLDFSCLEHYRQRPSNDSSTDKEEDSTDESADDHDLAAIEDWFRGTPTEQEDDE